MKKKSNYILLIFICLGLFWVVHLVNNSKELKTFTDDDLLKKNELKSIKSKSLVFIMFTQEKCKFCIALNPTIDNVNKEISNRIMKYDISTDFKAKQNFKIKFVPTIVAYRNGKEIGRIDDELDTLYFENKDGSVSINEEKTEQLLIHWIEEMTKGEYLDGKNQTDITIDK